MKNRLDYQTQGGAFSEGDTFAQLIEYLRLAEECCYAIGHYRKAQDDPIVGRGWLGIGDLLKRTNHNVTLLATGKLRSSSGYRQ